MNISVIVPALNEESVIGKTLSNLTSHHQPHEVIVVDGGSRDQTRDIAIASGFAKVISSEPGRARQMNLGAKQTSGDVLLFLHADTKLPKNALEIIRQKIENQSFKAGRFRLKFDEEKWLLRFFASYTRFHSFSYGDQAFFVTRSLFDSIGGFREDVPFEDIEFYKRLRKITRPVIIKEPVITSARRFTSVGCMKQKFINLFLVGLYYAGWDVLSFKEKWYPDVR